MEEIATATGFFSNCVQDRDPRHRVKWDQGNKLILALGLSFSSSGSLGDRFTSFRRDVWLEVRGKNPPPRQTRDLQMDDSRSLKVSLAWEMMSRQRRQSPQSALVFGSQTEHRSLFLPLPKRAEIYTVCHHWGKRVCCMAFPREM